jgi:hypothetical protein
VYKNWGFWKVHEYFDVFDAIAYFQRVLDLALIYDLFVLKMYHVSFDDLKMKL